jgi:hypothetical protein
VLLHPVTGPDALVDNCFGLPLWLQTPCIGRTLWAFNARHLAYLKQFLQAELRERRGAGNLADHGPVSHIRQLHQLVELPPAGARS